MGNTKSPAENPDSRNLNELREPLSVAQVESFARFIDQALQKLESEFKSWIRPQGPATGRRS